MSLQILTRSPTCPRVGRTLLKHFNISDRYISFFKKVLSIRPVIRVVRPLRQKKSKMFALLQVYVYTTIDLLYRIHTQRWWQTLVINERLSTDTYDQANRSHMQAFPGCFVVWNYWSNFRESRNWTFMPNVGARLSGRKLPRCKNLTKVFAGTTSDGPRCTETVSVETKLFSTNLWLVPKSNAGSEPFVWFR
jgi:hypothetical protein